MSPIRRLAATAAAILALVATRDAGAVSRSTEARLVRGTVAALPAATGGGIYDPALQIAPPTSEDVLVDRLVVLGATPDVAWRVVGDLAPWHGQVDAAAGIATDAVARLVLEPAASDKAQLLALAYLSGEPLSLIGARTDDDLARRIADLRAQGIAGETSVWLARQEQQAALAGDDPAARVEAALGVIADDTLRAQLMDATIGASPVARSLVQERALIEGHRLDDERLAPAPAPLAACLTCPAFNYGTFAASTTPQTHTSSIGANDCRVYRFTVVSGRSYRFSLCPADNGMANFNSQIESSTYQNQICATGPTGASCGGLEDALNYTATYSGYFFVKVRNLDPVAGTYRLAFRETTPRCNNCPTSDFGPFTPTGTYTTHSSSIGPLECRIYKFTLTANHDYRFTLCDPDSLGTPTGASSAFAADLTLLNSACAAVGGPSPSPCLPGHEVDYRPTTTGTYYLRVAGDTISDTGAYTLAYRDRLLCTSCPAYDFGPFTPTQVYQTHGPQFIAMDSCKLYRFNVVAGRTYRFVTCANDSDGTATGGGHDSGFDTTLTAYNASCAFLSTNDDLPGCVPAWGSQLDVTPTYTGALYLRVANFTGSNIGSYTLAYRNLAGVCATCPAFDVAAPAPTLAYQTLPASTVENNGGCRVYRFQLTSGVRYRFTLCDPDSSGVVSGASATFDTVIDVLRSTCTLAASNDDGACAPASELDYVATATGFHYVRVRGKTPADFGNFQLAYRQFSGICRTCPSFDFGTFTPNQYWATHSSSIVAESCRVYRFQLTAGRTYEFSTCNGGGSAAFAAVVTAQEPDCDPIAPIYSDCAGDMLFTASVTGAYFVTVAGATPADAGAYTLAYREFTAACGVICPSFEYGPFTPTTAVNFHSDVLEDYCAFKTYRFNVTGGVTYHFSTCPPGSASFDSHLVLADSTCGAVADTTTFCGDDETHDYLATFTGPLTVYVVNDAGGTGTYTLAYWRDP